MSRALDWLLAGGVAGGVYWFVRRARRPNDDARLVEGIRSREASIETTSSRGGLTRQYDELFLRHGQGIPVAYLRALAQAESGMRAADPLGLINVVPVALADFNRRHPDAAVAADKLRDPTTNIRVAGDILRTVIASYAKHHPDVPNLREDWSNQRFVELATAGWNAGFSERAGVGKVVGHLKARASHASITIDDVFEAAKALPDASRHLRNERKRRYAKGVAAAYARERERDRQELSQPLSRRV